MLTIPEFDAIPQIQYDTGTSIYNNTESICMVTNGIHMSFSLQQDINKNYMVPS